MRAILCDCCECRIKTEDKESVYTIEVKKGTDVLNEREGHYKKELCEQCITEVKNWIDSKGDQPWKKK